jgi:hypothetical protein
VAGNRRRCFAGAGTEFGADAGFGEQKGGGIFAAGGARDGASA